MAGQRWSQRLGRSGSEVSADCQCEAWVGFGGGRSVFSCRLRRRRMVWMLGWFSGLEWVMRTGFRLIMGRERGVLVLWRGA